MTSSRRKSTGHPHAALLAAWDARLGPASGQDQPTAELRVRLLELGLWREVYVAEAVACAKARRIGECEP